MAETETSTGVPPSTALARRDVADELVLQPEEGLGSMFGPRIKALLLRLVSMIEQPIWSQSGPITPTDAWFRRDRHRHPRIDPETYSLRVEGVRRPREFSLSELRQLPQDERICVMECAGNGNHTMGSAGLIGQARFRGPSLQTILEACGGPGDSTHFAFHGLDPIPFYRVGYHYGLSVDEVARARALVALTMNGEPLPRARGFPARLVVPGIYSMSHVKWLGRIVGKTSAHTGFWNRFIFVNKELRDGRWEKVEARWIGMKSLVTRCIRQGDGYLLTGWVWGGDVEPARIEVSTDGGQTWHEATMEPATVTFDDADPTDLEHAWSTFSYRWKPRPGTYRIASRVVARDGSIQSLIEAPHVRGHFNQTRIKWRRVRVPAA